MPDLGPLSSQTLGNKYLLGELLGEGGFGVVYKAQNMRLNRSQAIKVLRGKYANDPKFRERFEREAQTLASLDHPNILPVHDFDIEGNTAYLVMPFIGGGTLQDILDKRGKLSLEETAIYLKQMCAALDYAHTQKNIAHLDFKPLNLLVHEDGRLLLSDFGLAHLMKDGKAQGGTSLFLGSLAYKAPEQFRGEPTKRSDIYALGVTLYQMLSGKFPFEGTQEEIVIQHIMPQYRPPSLVESQSDLPKGLDAIIEKAMAKKPEERFATAGELLKAFNAVLSPQPNSGIPHEYIAREAIVGPPKSPSPTVLAAVPTVPAEIVSAPPRRTDPIPKERTLAYRAGQQSVLKPRQLTTRPRYKQVIRDVVAGVLTGTLVAIVVDWFLRYSSDAWGFIIGTLIFIPLFLILSLVGASLHFY